jgi:hypothetical protein
MKDSDCLFPPNVLVASGLPDTMRRQRISVRELLRAFNDPEQEIAIDEPAAAASPSEHATLAIRERTIGGRRVAVLYLWDREAATWELLHSTAWTFVH